MSSLDVPSPMDVLVPIDGSDCSERALRYATEFARNYGANLDVVHVTDHRTEATDELLDRAESILAEEGVDAVPELVANTKMSEARYADAVGKDVLRHVEEHDYDQVVMGHHGKGAVGKLLIGSAAETVVTGTDVPVTVVP